MKRSNGSIITAIGFWLILVSILSIPNSIQDALVIASAVGLIIISFSVGEKKPRFSFPQRKKKVKPEPKKEQAAEKPKQAPLDEKPSVQTSDKNDDVVVTKQEPLQEPKEENKSTPKKEGEGNAIHDYRDQGVSVTLRNDL
jgi:outer membrane biosynthesis protein TonB